MARKLNALILTLLAAATLFHGSAAQTRHVVGDSTGWTIPSGGASFYSNWAANKTFTVGDTLVFNFANGQHDVSKVTKSDFDSCSGGSSPVFVISTSPATVTLNVTGEQHFICGVGGHCSLGQKLAVNVVSKASNNTPPSTSTTPSPSSDGIPPSPSPSSAVSPPHKDSAARSFGAAGVIATTVLSVTAVLVFSLVCGYFFGIFNCFRNIEPGRTKWTTKLSRPNI